KSRDFDRTTPPPRPCVDIQTDEAVRRRGVRPPSQTRDRSGHTVTGRKFPSHCSGMPVEPVNMTTSSCVATGDDEIRRDEWIAMKEVLLGTGSGGRGPQDSARFCVQRSEHAV